jgi:L-ribulokinase
MSENSGPLENAHVTGVDFGTLSGRAVHPYAHAVVERALPATGEQLPPDWALEMPPDDRIAGAGPVPAGRKGFRA